MVWHDPNTALFLDWLDHDERYGRTDEFLSVLRGALSGTPFDFVIAIVEGLAKLFRQVAADRSFSCTHQSDKKNIAWNGRFLRRT